MCLIKRNTIYSMYISKMNDSNRDHLYQNADVKYITLSIVRRVIVCIFESNINCIQNHNQYTETICVQCNQCTGQSVEFHQLETCKQKKRWSQQIINSSVRNRGFVGYLSVYTKFGRNVFIFTIQAKNICNIYYCDLSTKLVENFFFIYAFSYKRRPNICRRSKIKNPEKPIQITTF